MQIKVKCIAYLDRSWRLFCRHTIMTYVDEYSKGYFPFKSIHDINQLMLKHYL